MRALITGTAGFIAGSLAQRLMSLGWEVNSLLREPGRQIPVYLKECKVFYSDFNQPNPVILRSAAKECDVVFHLAAVRNRWGTSSDEYARVNIEGTRQMIEACLNQAGRFIYVSSVGVYGFPGVLEIDETFPILNEHGKIDYHTSKVAAESIVRTFSPQIETVIIRPTITYGPGDESGMVTRLVSIISKGWPFTIGSGSNFIHLTFIEDLLDGLIRSALQPEAAGNIFNIAGNHPVKMEELVAIIKANTDVHRPTLPIPIPAARLAGTLLDLAFRFTNRMKSSYPKLAPPLTAQTVQVCSANRSFSYRKARQIIGYEPCVDIHVGLMLTVQWMKATGRIQ